MGGVGRSKPAPFPGPCHVKFCQIMPRQNGALPAAPVNVVKMAGRGDRGVRSKYAEDRTNHDPRGAQVEPGQPPGPDASMAQHEREGQLQAPAYRPFIYLVLPELCFCHGSGPGRERQPMLASAQSLNDHSRLRLGGSERAPVKFICQNQTPRAPSSPVLTVFDRLSK